MNEMELAAWSLWLDKVGWVVDGFNLEEVLIITGMQVKDLMNTKYEMDIYISKVQESYPGIKSLYEKWIEDKKHEIDLNIIEIHKKYNILRIVIHNVNDIA